MAIVNRRRDEKVISVKKIEDIVYNSMSNKTTLSIAGIPIFKLVQNIQIPDEIKEKEKKFGFYSNRKDKEES